LLLEVLGKIVGGHFRILPVAVTFSAVGPSPLMTRATARM
jgi:hypothetical protein